MGTEATIYKSDAKKGRHHFYVQPKLGKDKHRVLAAEHPEGETCSFMLRSDYTLSKFDNIMEFALVEDKWRILC